LVPLEFHSKPSLGHSPFTTIGCPAETFYVSLQPVPAGVHRPVLS
jgi:hypothetical protein